MMAKYEYPFRETFYHEGRRIDIKARTAKELTKKIVKKQAELNSAIVDGKTKLSDWIEKWLATYKAGKISVGWEKSLKSILDASVPPEIGNLPLEKVRMIHAQRILNSASEKSESYIHKLTITLNELFEVARKNKMIADNPMDLTVPPKGTKNKRRALTENEREHILKLVETHRAGLFIKLMLYCGLRPQEAATLQWRNVDLKNKVVRVESALKSDGSIGGPKSESGYREVPVPAPFLTELKNLKSENPFDYVCTNASGGRHTKQSIKQMWESFIYRLNKQMGCKTSKGGKLVPPYPVADDLVMYCLRHTYGTDLQRAGVSINVARELMGHSSVSVTEGYTHKSKEALNSAAKLIDKFYGVETDVETNHASIENK